MKKYTLIYQTEEKDCGLASLNMILLYYGETYSLDYLKKMGRYNNSEMDFFRLSRIAQKLGYTTSAYHINTLNEISHAFLPCIAQIEISKGVWHFIVLFYRSRQHVIIGDPAKSIYTTSIPHFQKYFTGFILKLDDRKIL